MNQQPEKPTPKARASRNGSTVRILHLEDSRFDADCVRFVLERGGLHCIITLASSKAEFESALQNREFDLVLCDHSIPGYDGFEGLELVKQKQPGVPVIILSGSLDDAHAVNSLKKGATDYILKSHQARLIPAIRRALTEATEKKNQQAAESRIREQAELLNLTRDAIIVRAMDNRIIFWNAGAHALFGWHENEAAGKDFEKLLQTDSARATLALRQLLDTGDWTGELRLKSKSGEEKIVLSHWNLVRGETGRPEAILSTNTDITERKKLESVLLRAQRMNCIGVLAGGIAHDLGNAIEPILVSAELLENHPEESVRRKVDVIRASAWRAIDMVKQILSFVKGREARASQVTLSNLLREMEKMARITFPKSIDIETDLVNTTTLRAVAGDPTELHQVLLNLCVNARDAMPSGGRLILSAQNIELTPEDAAALGGKPGPHVKISVADTGTGIAPEVLPRIFEPFFTTKLPDRGTGLGLSTVAGIVKRHGGCLDVKTTLGRGTEFQVYLPAAEQPELVTVTSERTPMPGGRGETILVIEDEEALLELTKEALETYGYNVVTAHNGTQGIARFEEAREKIKLVVTDTDMREMDGLTAARAIREMNPGLPVIIASGTQHDTSQLRRIEADKMVNLGKPYSLEQLLVAVASNIK